jgi:hypothetical protein
LRKYAICQILLNFRALLSGRLNTENLRIYFCANPKGDGQTINVYH